ncbi:MAG: phage portal protein [Proteobacteria bacterium]|nr:MAG: phage portal protein [Pseudomonadota bacterium]
MRRGYAAAASSRFNVGFPGVYGTGDAELRNSLRALRGRSRQLAQDSDLVKHWLGLLRKNVIGANGIALKMRARDPATGELDRDANRRIEDRWRAFLSRRLFTVRGTVDGIEAQWLVLEAVARDGEIFARHVRRFPNAHGYAIQLLESDMVDELLERPLRGGRFVRMGIEFDSWERPLFYYFRRRHPGELSWSYAAPLGSSANDYEAVPAADVVHPFVAERPTQTRGVPWTHTTAGRVDMLDGYEEAELVASRAASAKMGFYKTPSGEEYDGDDVDDDGSPIKEADPGVFEELPKEWEFQPYDPQHPTSQVGAFIRAITRRVSAGLNLSYHNVANDTEGLTYSSGRIAELGDRDFYRMLQGFVARSFLQPVFEEWLALQIMGGGLPLPLRKLDAYIAGARWQGRGWAWVDPAKEGQGHKLAYELRVNSLTSIALEGGRTLDEVFDEIAEEREAMRERGIPWPEEASAKSAAAPAPAPPADVDDDDDDPNATKGGGDGEAES